MHNNFIESGFNIMKSHEEIFLFFKVFLFFLVKSQRQEREKYF